MATYRFTSPNGETYEIGAPEGATEAEAFEYFQRQYRSGNVSPVAPEPKPVAQPTTPRDVAVQAMTAPETRSVMPPWDTSMALRMASNIPRSAGDYAKTILEGITSPVQAAKGLGSLVEAGIESVNPFMTEEQQQASPHYPVGQAFVRGMSERYGAPERRRKTLIGDPVGTLADVSGATLSAGSLTRTPALTKAGVALDPLNLATNMPLGVAGELMPRGLPASLYESAAKFPPTAFGKGPKGTQLREKVVDAALEGGIMPTQRGIDKVTAILSELDTRINTLIKEADATGRKIPRTRIYSELAEVRKNLSKGAGAPENIKKYRSIVDALENRLKDGPEDWTPSNFQDFKTATYRDINWKAKPSAKTETMQALARGARKAIEDVTPEIRDVNRMYGPLAELRDRLPQVANRIGNLNISGLTPGIYTAAGGAAADVPGALAGLALGIFDAPRIKAGTALALRGLQNRGLMGSLTSGSPAASMIRSGALQFGRLEDILE